MTSPYEEPEDIPPDIVVEEDSPFGEDAGNEQEKTEKSNPITEGSMELKKFALGTSMLGWCIFLMLLCILISLWKPDNELVQSGFEAFKLIVMTILGYIFGSNSKNS
ncbi:MAG: hypothetical protein HFI13_14385 [Lachnospiraceae bacterium]|nr:hypothetical protein [Lachnospiraceae bacterium]